VIRAATDPEAVGGALYRPAGRLGMRGRPVASREAAHRTSREDARRLWTASEELTGVEFP